MTSPLNLPAPGRRQAIYFLLTSSHSPMFLVNSRYPRFSATPKSSLSLDHPRRHAFSRSYGIILPSSLTGVIPSALVFSTCLPVSVCGTIAICFIAS